MSLSKFLHELAEHLAKKFEGKRVGDVADGLMERIGFDDWLVDYIIGWAKTDEPLAFFEAAGGRVWTQEVGFSGHKVPSVWMVITPMSDPQGLMDKAKKLCQLTLPPETYSRYGWDVRSHQVAVMRSDGKDWGEVAEAVLDDEEPHWRQAIPSEQRLHRRQTIKKCQKQYERFWDEYWNSFCKELDPELDD